MASLVQDKNGNFLVAFRWAGKQYTRSLDTRDRDFAEAGVRRVDETLMRLKRGWASLPAGCDPGTFIASGGVHAAKPTQEQTARPMSLGELFDRYLADIPDGHKEKSTLGTEKTHMKHLRRLLGETKAVPSISLADVQGYHNKRGKQIYHGEPTKARTIKKELATLRYLWGWGLKHGHLASPPSWELKEIDFKKEEREREPFRTMKEIRERIRRNGLTEADQKRLWECLYLRDEEVRDVLAYVRDHATAGFVYPMFVFCALTGARRSELCRSRIDDFDFENMVVQVREKKRDRTRKETIRNVEMHTRLREVMQAWFAAHPGGPYTLCQQAGHPLTKDEATDHFNRTLEDSDHWKHIPGFHTFRHSFASILASKGHDQRIIDALMGHQTEDMRKRYRHLFPANRKRAIDDLLA